MNNEDFKVVLSDKEYIEKLEKEVYYQNKEVTRLNNIINELEKALKSHKDIKVMAHYGEYYVEIEEIYNYLQELKENNKDV